MSEKTSFLDCLTTRFGSGDRWTRIPNPTAFKLVGFLCFIVKGVLNLGRGRWWECEGIGYDRFIYKNDIHKGKGEWFVFFYKKNGNVENETRTLIFLRLKSCLFKRRLPRKCTVLMYAMLLSSFNFLPCLFMVYSWIQLFGWFLYLISIVSFLFPIEVGSHNPPSLGAQCLYSHTV